MKNHIKYSVIIPTLNEEKYIVQSITSVKNALEYSGENGEIIIVDAQSTDNTIKLVCELDVKVINSKKGRGTQIRNGVKEARGDILLFLHADSKLPQNTFDFLSKSFSPEMKTATFKMKFDEPKIIYKLYSFFTRFDSIFSTFGDQLTIVRKDFYDDIGGIKNIPIMEDVDFFRKVRRINKIYKLDKYITVSTRRFRKKGLIKTQLTSFICIVRYLMGVSPNLIYNEYYNYNDSERQSNNSICEISGVRQG